MPLRSGCRSLAWGSPYLAGLSALAVEVGHLRLGVAPARGGTGRHGLLYGGEVGFLQPDVQRAEPLGQPVAAPGADQRHDVLAAREYPSDGDLRDRDALLLGDLVQGLDEVEVVLEVLALKARRVPAEVVGGQLLVPREVPGD